MRNKADAIAFDYIVGGNCNSFKEVKLGFKTTIQESISIIEPKRQFEKHCHLIMGKMV